VVRDRVRIRVWVRVRVWIVWCKMAVRTGGLGDRVASSPTGRPGDTAKKEIPTCLIFHTVYT